MGVLLLNRRVAEDLAGAVLAAQKDAARPPRKLRSQGIKSSHQGSFRPDQGIPISISTWPRGGGFSGVGPGHANAGLSRSGVSGARRRCTPVASKMAAATGRIELSPAPAGGSSRRLILSASPDLRPGFYARYRWFESVSLQRRVTNFRFLGGGARIG